MNSLWPITELGIISEVKGGKRLPKGKALVDVNTGHPYIRVSDINDSGISLKDIKYVPYDVTTKISAYRVFENDLYITVAGTLGLVGKVQKALSGANLTENADRITNISNDADINFILYVMRSDIVQNEIKKVMTQSAQPKLALTRIRKFKIPLPPLPEQQKIAEILSTWDETITKIGQLIAALSERKKSFMQRLLTGQVRFPGFEKSKGKQHTKFGEIPADWSYITISEIARHVSKKNIKGNNLPVLSCTKYDGLVDSLTYFGRRIFSEDTSTYKIVKRGQFAYATNHIEEGSIGYQSLYDNALISPMYTVFETNNKIDDGFLYKLLKTELYRHIFEVNTSASVDRRGSLRWNVFEQIKIPLPTIEEQKAIAEVLDLNENEIRLTQKLLVAFQNQKKGLMQRLLTGKVRVKV